MNKQAAPQSSGILVAHEYDQIKVDSIMAALHDRKFFVCLQPKFLMPARRIIGAEAFLRWNEPGVGIIFPNEFVSSAEGAGLMELLDLYALEEVCAAIKKWLDSGKPVVPVGINLSASALLSPGFIDAVNGCMARYTLPRGCIEFEFSMAFTRDYPDEFARIVSCFHDRGFCCAVDGFSRAPDMLKSVIAYKIDTIKLDCHSFVNADDEEGIRNCVKAFNEARDMGVNVILEGVESPRQLEALIDSGCEYMQGYTLSMPISPSLFLRMIECQGE